MQVGGRVIGTTTRRIHNLVHDIILVFIVDGMAHRSLQPFYFLWIRQVDLLQAGADLREAHSFTGVFSPTCLDQVMDWLGDPDRKGRTSSLNGDLASRLDGRVWGEWGFPRKKLPCRNCEGVHVRLF